MLSAAGGLHPNLGDVVRLPLPEVDRRDRALRQGVRQGGLGARQSGERHLLLPLLPFSQINFRNFGEDEKISKVIVCCVKSIWSGELTSKETNFKVQLSQKLQTFVHP